MADGPVVSDWRGTLGPLPSTLSSALTFLSPSGGTLTLSLSLSFSLGFLFCFQAGLAPGEEPSAQEVMCPLEGLEGGDWHRHQVAQL